MSLETYLSFVIFVIAMTGTPGVGNLTMMAIGQTAGFRGTVPFLAGTTLGMLSLNILVGLGLGALLTASPRLTWVLKIGGMAYIGYLGWKILSMQLDEVQANKRFTVAEGVLVHPTNPKSWAMSVVGFSQVASPELALWQQMAVFVPTFLLFQVGFHSLWGYAGAAIVRSLASGRALLAVNVVLVAAMLGATGYALFA